VSALAGSRTDGWQQAFRHYADNPADVWPAERSTQCDKFVKRQHELAERLCVTPQDAIDWVLATARVRAAARPATIFLLNCGSSGSHWLEAMLAALPAIAPCGEVYLPKGLVKEITPWPAADRSAYLDCVHLLHAQAPPDKVAAASLINSAHMSGLRMARLMEAPTFTVLLIRDPVDIVISRTFRKQDYRDLVQPTASNAEYLRTNIEFVDKFFRRMAAERVDAKVRYEEIRRDAAGTLTRLLGDLGHRTDADDVARIAAAFSADAQQAGAQSGRSNLYRGPEVQVPDALREETLHALADARCLFGYGPATTS
jgi:hypothetical protein